tara:strand:- start:959 stop:1306 length:348 start_codon:yes stop_codon:yes gene_type:complete
MTKTENSKHDKIVERIKRKPGLIGLVDVAVSTSEPIVWNGRKNPVVPDGIFFMKDGSVVVWDYKSSNTRRVRHEEILREYKNVVEDYFEGRKVRCLYVYGNNGKDELSVEELFTP